MEKEVVEGAGGMSGEMLDIFGYRCLESNKVTTTAINSDDDQQNKWQVIVLFSYDERVINYSKE